MGGLLTLPEVLPSSDIATQASRSKHLRQTRVCRTKIPTATDLEGDLALVLEVVGQVDSGHPALTDLTLDAVAALEGGVEAGDGIGH